jgi:DNA polymerase-3 subunit epsilon
MPLFLYVLAAYDPDDDRAYPAYAVSDIPLDPGDEGERDVILRLLAQGHGRPDDGDYAEIVGQAYARLRVEGSELDRHALAAPLPHIPPDRLRAAVWIPPGVVAAPPELARAARAEAVAWARDLLTRPDEWLLFDCETTGLDDPSLVEVAAVDSRGAAIVHQRLRPHPSRPLEAAAIAIHGLTDGMLAGQPTFAERHAALAAALAGRTLLAYAATFDRTVWEADERRYGLAAAPLAWEDLAAWRGAYGGDWSPRHHAWRYPALGGDHTALGDCHAALALLRALAGEAQ